MVYEQRDNSGTLFKNERKVDGDNKPNMTGKAMIDGVMYFFDAWTKDGAKGKFQSVSFKRMDTQVAAATAPAEHPIDDGKPPF
jgi:hypothetical protein